MRHSWNKREMRYTMDSDDACRANAPAPKGSSCDCCGNRNRAHSMRYRRSLAPPFCTRVNAEGASRVSEPR